MAAEAASCIVVLFSCLVGVELLLQDGEYSIKKSRTESLPKWYEICETATMSGPVVLSIGAHGFGSR